MISLNELKNFGETSFLFWDSISPICQADPTHLIFSFEKFDSFANMSYRQNYHQKTQFAMKTSYWCMSKCYGPMNHCNQTGY